MSENDKILESKIALLQVGDSIIRENGNFVSLVKILHISKDYIFTDSLHYYGDMLSYIRKSDIGLTCLRKDLYFSYSNARSVHYQSKQFYTLTKNE